MLSSCVPVMSTLANVTVYCLNTKTTLTQWRIQTVNPPDVTFIDFLRDSYLTQTPCELKKVYVRGRHYNVFHKLYPLDYS